MAPSSSVEDEYGELGSSYSQVTSGQIAHHAFGFQQVLSAVTHALASKQTPNSAAAGQQAKRDLDKKRTAASATGLWAEMLLC